MLILRFQRQGKKKDFIFRIVAVDSKIAVNSGKATEILGWLDPKTNRFELKKDRILYWLNQGAQVSDSCYNLLVKAKIVEGKKRPIKITKKKVKKGQSTEGTEQAEKEQSIEDKPAEEIKEEKKEEPIEEKKLETETKEEQIQESEPKIKEEKQETPVEELKEKPKEKVEEKSDAEKSEK
jgi:small subunit ribosomal protein S16